MNLKEALHSYHIFLPWPKIWPTDLQVSKLLLAWTRWLASMGDITSLGTPKPPWCEPPWYYLWDKKLGTNSHVHFEEVRTPSTRYGENCGRDGRRRRVIGLTKSEPLMAITWQTILVLTAVRQYLGIHIPFQLLWVEILSPPSDWNTCTCTPVIAPGQATSDLPSYPRRQLSFVHGRLPLLTVYYAVSKRRRKKFKFLFSTVL